MYGDTLSYLSNKSRAYQLKSADGFQKIYTENLRPNNLSNNSNIGSNFLMEYPSLVDFACCHLLQGCDCMTDKPSFIRDDFACGSVGDLYDPSEYLWEFQEWHQLHLVELVPC